VVALRDQSAAPREQLFAPAEQPGDSVPRQRAESAGASRQRMSGRQCVYQTSREPPRRGMKSNPAGRPLEPSSSATVRLPLEYATVVPEGSCGFCVNSHDLTRLIRPDDASRRRSTPDPLSCEGDASARCARSGQARDQVIGSVISNTAPPSLRAEIVPPWRSTIALTIDKPSPLPPAALREASTL